MHVKNKQKSKTIGVPKPKNQCAKTEKSHLFVILKKLYKNIEFKMVFTIVYYVFCNISKNGLN